MIVRLSDVPRYERHLLFCSRLMPRQRSPRRRHRRDSSPSGKPNSPAVACADTAPDLIPLAAGSDAAGDERRRRVAGLGPRSFRA